jgi:hypothetical protein
MKLMELTDRYDQLVDEKNKVELDNENLQKLCQEWENNTNVAAQSAFEWEAHSSAVTSHFESLMAEWQTANDALVDENNKLQVLVGEYEQEMLRREELEEKERTQQRESDHTERSKSPSAATTSIASEPITTTASYIPTTTATMATAVAIATDHPLPSSSSSVTADSYDKNLIQKQFTMLLQLSQWKLAQRERRGDLQRAFNVFKFNKFFHDTREMYTRKCAEYLKSTQDKMKAEYMALATAAAAASTATSDSSSSSNGSDIPHTIEGRGNKNHTDNPTHTNTTAAELAAAQVRAKFNELHHYQLTNRETEHSSIRLNRAIMVG